MKVEFDLEYQYQLYLKRVELIEFEMHPEQKKQLRQAFMGSAGQMMLLLRDEVSKLEEAKAVEVMQNMLEQVDNYFLNLEGEQN